VEEDLWI